MKIENIYAKTPVWVQNAACYIKGTTIKKKRYGRGFYSSLKKYEEHKIWTDEEMKNYQYDRLKLMLKHCYETVPYYRNKWNEIGFDYNKVKSVDDLSVLPVINKKDVISNLLAFVSEAVPPSEIKIHFTSGTTGGALPFYTTWSEEQVQWAVWWRYRKNIGIDFDMLCGHFGGKNIVPIEQIKPPYWRYNIPCKLIYYSSYHINSKTWRSYYESLKKFSIKWIHGYPSVIARLAKYMIENNVFLDLEIVTIGAENLYYEQAELIKKAFLNGKDKVYEHYGLTEGVANISQDMNHNWIVDDDFAYVEFLDTGRKNINEKRIIGTTLTNFVMPLIRYDTGDLILIDNNKIIDIAGRDADVLRFKNGVEVSGATFNLIFASKTYIRECQVIKKDEALVVRVLPTNGLTFDQIAEIINEIKARVGYDVTVEIVEVENIERTSSGKFKAVLDYDK